MKQTTLYTCEYCGTSYNDAEKCKQCEDNHEAPQKIIDARYRSFKSDNTGYPYAITVLFDDGGEIEYSR